MATVTGYQIHYDTDNDGPGIDDGVSGGNAIVEIDTLSQVALGQGDVDYYNTVGVVSGLFYQGDDGVYFVPDDDTGFPPFEGGWVTAYTEATTGTTGIDSINGTTGRDVIHDTDGSFADPTGMDNIEGGDGADVIIFGDGDDTVRGRDGDDTIGLYTTGSGNNVLDGGAGDDTVIGGSGNDQIEGGDGNDFLTGGQGTDSISAGTGTDQILVADDHDYADIQGGEGADDFDTLILSGNTTCDGVDVVFTDSEKGTFAFQGITTIGVFEEIEEIVGTDYADTLDASASATSISLDGKGGDDTLTGGAGADRLVGGAGSDTLTGGAGADEFAVLDGDGHATITDFTLSGAEADQLDLSGLTNANGEPVKVGDIDVSDDGSGNALLSFPNGETLTLEGIIPDYLDGPTLQAMGVPCFTAGTAIRTANGDVTIDALCPGDMVQTLDNGLQPIVWIGQRRLSRTDLVFQPKLLPVLVHAGALGNERDMLVSPQHGMVTHSTDGQPHLARAIHLALDGGPGFRIARGIRRVTYFHLMFEHHQIVMSDGTPSESFYPGPMATRALAAAQRAEVSALFPGLMPHTRTLAQIAAIYGPTARSFLRRHEVSRNTADLFRAAPAMG